MSPDENTWCAVVCMHSACSLYWFCTTASLFLWHCNVLSCNFFVDYSTIKELILQLHLILVTLNCNPQTWPLPTLPLKSWLKNKSFLLPSFLYSPSFFIPLPCYPILAIRSSGSSQPPVSLHPTPHLPHSPFGSIPSIHKVWHKLFQHKCKYVWLQKVTEDN